MRQAMLNKRDMTHSKIYRFFAFLVSLLPRVMLHRNIQKMALLREQKRFLLNNLVSGIIRLPEFRDV